MGLRDLGVITVRSSWYYSPSNPMPGSLFYTQDFYRVHSLREKSLGLMCDFRTLQASYTNGHRVAMLRFATFLWRLSWAEVGFCVR